MQVLRSKDPVHLTSLNLSTVTVSKFGIVIFIYKGKDEGWCFKRCNFKNFQFVQLRKILKLNPVLISEILTIKYDTIKTYEHACILLELFKTQRIILKQIKLL